MMSEDHPVGPASVDTAVLPSLCPVGNSSSEAYAGRAVLFGQRTPQCRSSAGTEHTGSGAYSERNLAAPHLSLVVRSVGVSTAMRSPTARDKCTAGVTPSSVFALDTDGPPLRASFLHPSHCSDTHKGRECTAANDTNTPPRCVDEIGCPKQGEVTTVVAATASSGTLSVASASGTAAHPVSPTFSAASRSPTKLSHDAPPFYPQSRWGLAFPASQQVHQQQSQSRYQLPLGVAECDLADGPSPGRCSRGAHLNGHYNGHASSPAHAAATTPLSPAAPLYTPSARSLVHLSSPVTHPATESEGAVPTLLLASPSTITCATGTASSASHSSPPVALGEDDPQREFSRAPLSYGVRPHASDHYSPLRSNGQQLQQQQQQDFSDGSREYRHAPPVELRNVTTGAPIPVPEEVVVVDTVRAFAAFESVCHGLLEMAEVLGAPANPYCEGLPLGGPDGEEADPMEYLELTQTGSTATSSAAVQGVRRPAAALADAEDFALTVALDLEGHYLGRHGHLSILTFATTTAVYAIDMIMLPREVLLASAGTAFSQVLQSPRIVKLMFDCRADCDTLFFQFGVRLRAVCDLQVGAGISLSGCGAKYLIGMEDAFARLGLFRDDERSTKSAGRKVFDARLGGDCECWEDRPLDPLLLRYCAVDVKHFFEAFYRLRTFAFQSSFWAAKRVSYVCRGTYDAQSRVNARSDFRSFKWLLLHDE